MKLFLRAVVLGLSMLGATAGRCDSQQTYLDCLVDFERYAEANWHTATHANAPPDSGYFGDGSGDSGGGIRASCGTALAYAVLVQAFPAATNRATRLDRVRQALNYAANTHVSSAYVCTDGTQWGHSWGTAYLSGHLGVACLVAQSNLPLATIQFVQRETADEATYRAGIPPASGYVSDTKAEENSWNSQVVALAAAWMSTNANAGLWLTSAKQYLANTHTVADTNGDPLASWITTITHYSDFALENHGFYHPGYKAASGELIGDSWLIARLANPAIAAELEPFATHNVLPAWTNFSHLLLDSGEMVFPAGEDWDLNDYEQNAYLAWMATHFNDPLARWADDRVAQLERYRQMVNGDGRFVGPSTSVAPPYLRESIQAFRSALAWLHWNFASYPTGPSLAPNPAFLHMPDVGIIEQRGSNGFFSICYGPQTNGSPAKIMAVIEAPTTTFPNDVYTVAPRVPGVLGLGAMGTPTKAGLVSLVTNGNAFTAELTLTNGANGTTEVYVDCTGETIAIVEVPHPASGFVNSAAGSFTTGIENAPLNGGSRLVEWNNGSAIITNLTGVSRSVTNDWICVAGHYGMACGPSGYFKYQAATGYGHGTATDTLQFMPTNSLTPRFAVWFPGQNAAQTSSNASRVSWVSFSTNWTLGFPGPGGSLHQIVVPHPALAITTQPHALAVSNGQPAAFTVVANAFGDEAQLAYQWQKNGSNVAGATNSSFAIPAVGPADVGGYQCVVAVPSTNMVSATAQLRILPNASLPAVTSGTLLLYLRADAGVATNTAGVTNWFDQSPNGFRFDAPADFSTTFPPSAAFGPTGNRVIHFNGNGRFAGNTSVQFFAQTNSPLTIFTAFSTDDNSIQRYLLNLRVPRTNSYYNEMSVGVDAGNRGAGNYGIHRAAGDSTFAPANSISNGQFYVMSLAVKSNGAAPDNLEIYQNGAALPVAGYYGSGQPTDAGWLSAGHYAVGSYPLYIGVMSDSSSAAFVNYWAGDIGEIIVYRGQLSPHDRAVVESYLGAKYGTPVTSLPALAITMQPQTLAVTNGQSATFNVAATAASGENDFGYQWQKDGGNLAGATTASLVIPAASAADAANYQCVVSIPTTNIASLPAQLRIIPIASLPAVASGNLLLYLRADAGVITNSSGVTNWFDQSTNSFRFDAKADLVATFAPTMAIGGTGNRIVHFAGNNRLLSTLPVQLFTETNSPLTIFTAFSVHDNSAQTYLFNLTVPRTNRAFLEMSLGVDAGNDGAGNYGIHRAASGATYAPVGSISNDQFYVMSLVINSNGAAPANFSIYRNAEILPVSGTPANSPTAPYTEPGWLSAGHYPKGSYPLNLGAAQDSGNTNNLFGFWSGDIGEVIVYQGQLSDGDRLAVQTYLGRKYGLLEAQLKIARNGGNVILSYPALAGAYVLESASNLDSPASWTAVTPAPEASGNQFLATNTTVSQKFYRLRLP